MFYGNNENVFIYDNDYIVLIRIHGDDFENEDAGTVHIGFGYSAEATRVAAACFVNETNTLYQYLKKHKKHYFVIMKYTQNGEFDFSKNSFLDITKIMFGSD